MRCLPLLWILFPGFLAMAQDCSQTMPAIFLDEQRRPPVPAITSGRLHAKLGSLTVPVTSVERIANFRVLILFDASGSMEQTDVPFGYQRKALALINATFDDLMGELPQGTNVEYGVFNSRAVFGPKFTAYPEDLRKSLVKLNELSRRGHKGTALYDALQESLARFDPPQPGDSIVIVTDGMDNESRLKAGKVQEEASRKGVRLFSILIRGNEFDYQGAWLMILDFSERTGGSVHVINVGTNPWTGDKGAEEERQELRRFWKNEIISGYLLHFNLPAGTKKQRKWLLSVDRLPGQKRKVLAAYPSRLNPCPVTSATAH
jgi:hypothetical protein